MMNEMRSNKRIVILCSGGMDSVTVLKYFVNKYGSGKVHALFINYGQSALVAERAAATIAAKTYGVSFKEVSINLKAQNVLKSTIMSTVTDKKIDTIKTYVPARNMLLIAIACAYAIGISANEVGIGVHFDDDPLAYPDCKPAFINPMRKACAEYGIILRAPFLFMSKKEIVNLGTKLGIDYEKTMSCYWPDSDGKPCGKCPSCELRDKGFREYDEEQEDQTNTT